MHGTSAKAPILGKSAVTTDPKIIQLDHFFVMWRTPRQELVFQSAQKVGQKVIPTQMNLQSPVQLWTLFSNPSKIGFSKPHCWAWGVTPAYVTREKQLWSRTDGRTNGRTNGRTHTTSGFDSHTDVKSASRKNSYEVMNLMSTWTLSNLFQLQ